MEFPVDLKYSENDEWIRVEGKIGIIGITDYAQDQLSDIVYLEIMVEVGKQLEKGATFAEVESVKAAAEVYLPVAGVITEVNDSLTEMPEVINSDPFGEGWMVKLEINDPSEVETLLDATAYEKYCEGREH